MLPEKTPKAGGKRRSRIQRSWRGQGCKTCILYWRLHSLDGLVMSQECLMSGYQRKYSMENYRWERARKEPKRNAKKNHKSLPKGYTTRVLGTDWSGSSKVALLHQKGSRWLSSKENLRSRKKAQRAQSQSHGIIIRVVRLVTLRTDLLYLQQTG